MGWTMRALKCYRRQLLALLVPVLLLPLPATFGDRAEMRCAYIILIMAIFWITETLPLPVTALIPVFAYPILGILSTRDVCLNYFVDPIMLFLGGFMFAVAIEGSGLSRRIALFIVLRIGRNPRLLMAGFMTTTMFLSMWISNTAATAMVIPTLNAILEEIDEKWKPPSQFVIPKITITDMEENKETNWGEVNQGFESDFEVPGITICSADSYKGDDDEEEEYETEEKKEAKVFNIDKLRRSLYLSVAYAANIGGTGLITGTPPNLSLLEILNISYGDVTEVNFLSWMAFNIPLMIICTFVGWAWLQYYYYGLSNDEGLSSKDKEKKKTMRRILKAKYNALRSLSFHEGVVIVLFFVLLVFWVFRDFGHNSGWSQALKHFYGDKSDISDTSVIIFVILLLFIIPSNLPQIMNSKSSEPVSCCECLSWKTVEETIPWDVVLLIGGGYAMAEGAKSSQLTLWISQQFSDFHQYPLPLLVMFATLIAVCITNIAPSNATAALLLPIFHEMSLSRCYNPLHLMLPVTISCSYAFILPVSSPPNAIVYYASDLKHSEMIKSGIGMSIICFILVNIMIHTLAMSIFSLDTPPSWINSTALSENYSCYYK